MFRPKLLCFWPRPCPGTASSQPCATARSPGRLRPAPEQSRGSEPRRLRPPKQFGPTTYVRSLWCERYLLNDDLVCYTSNRRQARSVMKIGTVVLGSASLLLIVAAVAQTAPPPGAAGQRKANQQARIAQGLKDVS